MAKSSALTRNIIGAALLGCTVVLTAAVTGGDPKDVEMGTRLAELLRAGRSIVSNYQMLINDPTISDKGLDSARFVEEAVSLYTERRGSEPLSGDLSERDRRLIEAQLDAMREVLDEHQDDINREGIGFKGFVPAIFARLINEKFADKVGTEARVRVTAPEQLVRNRKSRPDAWEADVIKNKLLSPQWSKDQIFAAAAHAGGRDSFRVLVPEYYTAGCLTCHGEPKGEIDVTGYPKEGGKAGDLGGAISIVLFK